MFVVLVSDKAHNGNTKKDPLLFEHFAINSIALYREVESVPYNQPFQHDFEKGMCVRSYMQMLQSLEMFNCNINNGITLENYSNGSTLFAFNLTPDLSAVGLAANPTGRAI